jgi:hypothetical protein
LIYDSSSRYINTYPKPHNYFNELSPEQQEELRRLDAMIAEAKRYRKIGEAVNMFESFQRWLKNARPTPIPNPTRKKRRRRLGPSVEQVAIARGIIRIVSVPVSDSVSTEAGY